MVATRNIDSNTTGGYIAEQVDDFTLPSEQTPPSETVWIEGEVNSWSDTGGQYESLARTTINENAVDQKGETVKVEANAGYSSDLTPNNLNRLMQGYVRKDAAEYPTNNSLYGLPADFTVSGVAADGITIANGSVADGRKGLRKGLMIRTSGFSTSANNKDVVVLTAATDTKLSATFSVEASPPATATVEVIGMEIPNGDEARLVVTGSAPRYTSVTLVLDSAATTDFTKFGFEEGVWLGVGGQAPYNQIPAGQDFAASVPVLEEVQKPFYARISKIETLKLTFDLVSSGDGQTLVSSHTGSNFSNVRLFFPSILRNTKSVNEIKYRQYQVERTLGKSDTAHTYQQSEYVYGCNPSTATINIPPEDKITIDLEYMALDNAQRDGGDDDVINAPKHQQATNTRVIPRPKEPYFNTSTNMNQIKMYLHEQGDNNVAEGTAPNPVPIFLKLDDITFAINNNLKRLPSVGDLGGFAFNYGKFHLTGSTNAYFRTVAGNRAISEHEDAGLYVICSKRNQAVVFDAPLMGLSGGLNQVADNEPVMTPVEYTAFESHLDYVFSIQYFRYIPKVLVAVRRFPRA